MKIIAAFLIVQIAVMFICYLKRCRATDYVSETFLDVLFTGSAIVAVLIAVRFFLAYV